jgi:hypothetical protein
MLAGFPNRSQHQRHLIVVGPFGTFFSSCCAVVVQVLKRNRLYGQKKKNHQKKKKKLGKARNVIAQLTMNFFIIMDT